MDPRFRGDDDEKDSFHQRHPLPLLLILALLPACEPGDMTRQGKVLPYEARDGISGSRLPPAGTVAQAAEPVPRPAATTAVLARGGERYAIFCAPCHGATGDGADRVPTIPPPPSFHGARLAAAPPEHVYDVITRGRGRMYPFAGRIPDADRWAIALWVKQLQAEHRP